MWASSARRRPSLPRPQANFVYIGYDPVAPEAEAIVVPKDSPISRFAELRGKKVALNRAAMCTSCSSRHLKRPAGTPTSSPFLPPADARAGVRRAVDAWVTGTFLAAVEKQTGARIRPMAEAR